MDLDKQKLFKRLLILIISKLTTETFVRLRSSSLLIRKAKVNSQILSEWIIQWSKKGNTANKQDWERFIQRFVPIATYNTETTAQSCHVTWTDSMEKPEKKHVETMIVWNGNGMRTRWKGKSEFKELVRMSDPFCASSRGRQILII